MRPKTSSGAENLSWQHHAPAHPSGSASQRKPNDKPKQQESHTAHAATRSSTTLTVAHPPAPRPTTSFLTRSAAQTRSTMFKCFVAVVINRKALGVLRSRAGRAGFERREFALKVLFAVRSGERPLAARWRVLT